MPRGGPHPGTGAPKGNKNAQYATAKLMTEKELMTYISQPTTKSRRAHNMPRGGPRPGAGAPKGNKNAQYNMMAEIMTEKELMTHISQAANAFGWRRYHTFYAHGSDEGFPDLIMIRNGQVLAWELKSARGKLTPAQQAWLEAWSQVPGVEARLIRPANLEWAYARLAEQQP